jgi:hypothetical protein
MTSCGEGSNIKLWRLEAGLSAHREESWLLRKTPRLGARASCRSKGMIVICEHGLLESKLPDSRIAVLFSWVEDVDSVRSRM